MFIYSVAITQLRNAPFGTSPRLAARSLSRTGRFFASKIAIADAGLRFCATNLGIDP